VIGHSRTFYIKSRVQEFVFWAKLILEACMSVLMLVFKGEILSKL